VVEKVPPPPPLARWKGDGPGRGHWRLVCPMCSERLGQTPPLSERKISLQHVHARYREDLHAHIQSDHDIESDHDFENEGPVEEFCHVDPSGVDTISVEVPGTGREYRQRRSKVWIIRDLAEPGGRYNLPEPRRAGRRRHSGGETIDSFIHRQYSLEDEFSGRAHQRNAEQTEAIKNGRIVVGTRSISLSEQVECPRVGCGAISMLGVPADLRVIAILGEFYVILRANDLWLTKP